MGNVKIGLHEFSVNPAQLIAPLSYTQRVARTNRGEVGVYRQGPNLRALNFPIYIIRDDRTGSAVIDATTQVAAAEAEISRPYIITMQADALKRPDNTTGKYFATLDSINPVVPGPGGRADALLPGKTIYFQADLAGVCVPWNEYRRCRYHGKQDVTLNTFGLAGEQEMPLPIPDGALTLDGATQYAETTTCSAALNLTASIKIKFTVNPDSVTGVHTFPCKRSAAANGNFIVRSNGSKLEFSYHAAAGGAEHTYQTATGAIAIGVKQRVYVTFTYGTASSILICVDGIKKTGGSWTAGNGTAAPSTASTTYSIGRDANAGNYADCDISDVAIDNVLGTETDALLDARLMFSKLESTTVGLWKLNERVGTTAYDHAGNNDLTITGAPSFTGGYLEGAAPSETVDYFRRTAIGVIPVVGSQELALCLFEAHDYALSVDKINVTWYDREVQVDNNLVGFRTRHEESTKKGRVDLVYWNKTAWNTSHISAFEGRVKSPSGSWEEFTESAPSVDIDSTPEQATVMLTYPSTSTNGYNVKVILIIKRGSPIIKTLVYNAGMNLNACAVELNLTGTNFTKRTQLGATVDAGSNNPATVTSLTSGANAAAATSYTTASISPSGRKLILLTFLNTKAAAPDAISSVAGCGLTWELVGTVSFNSAAAPTKRLTIYRAMSLTTPTPGTVVVSFGAATQTGGTWSICELDGVDLSSGLNGSGAIVQVITNTSDSATSLTVTLAAFSNLANATFGAHGISANNTFNVGSGFTEIHDTGHATPANELQTEWKNSNDTSVDADNGAAAVAWGGIAVELKAGEAIADSDSNNHNSVHTADPWATSAVAAGFISAKKVDRCYVAKDGGAYWSSVGLMWSNLTIEENQTFPAFYWWIGRADCISRTAAQLGGLALRELVVKDDIERVVA